MPPTTPRPTEDIAFALGGLAGSNAHGAGFLQAAMDSGSHPQAISCTSGMVVWTAHYLAGQDLAAIMGEMARQSAPLPPPWEQWNSLLLGAVGVPGVFRPAWPEYWMRWFVPPGTPGPKAWADRAFPAQRWVPTRAPEFFAFVSDTINAADIGVIFNSYNPQLGVEYLYINEAMRRLSRVEYGGTSDRGAVYRPVTPEAVEAALWLFGYGHERRFGSEHLVDGAYHRQFILSELAEGPRSSKPAALYVVRPQNLRWLGHLPHNQFEQQDLQTEMSMNNTYVGQTSRIVLINNLLKKGKLKKEDYRYIDVLTLEIDMQRGFFDYFVERQEVFDEARRRGAALLQRQERAAA